MNLFVADCTKIQDTIDLFKLSSMVFREMTSSPPAKIQGVYCNGSCSACGSKEGLSAVFGEFFYCVAEHSARH